MKSGETAGQGNGRPCVPNRTQAKRAGPKLEAGPKASAERSEGTMEARQGRDSRSEARCAARERGPTSSGDAMPIKCNNA